jgi:hypothetical protein
VVFLFATELATEMGFTDDCYTYGRDPSVTPSVLFLPTDFIAVTDGISPSIKLDNVVIYLGASEGITHHLSRQHNTQYKSNKKCKEHLSLEHTIYSFLIHKYNSFFSALIQILY